MSAPRLHWTRGRAERGGGEARALEWIGLDDAWASPSPASVGYFWGRCGRVFSLAASTGRWRWTRKPKVIQLLRPSVPDGGGWLACIGGQVVGRVRTSSRCKPGAHPPRPRWAQRGLIGPRG